MKEEEVGGMSLTDRGGGGGRVEIKKNDKRFYSWRREGGDGWGGDLESETWNNPRSDCLKKPGKLSSCRSGLVWSSLALVFVNCLVIEFV